MTYGFKAGKNKQPVFGTDEFADEVESVMAPQMAEKQNQHKTMSIVLPADGWTTISGGAVVDSDTQTVACQIVTANNTIIVSAAPESAQAYGLAGIICISQSAGSLTFHYQFKPVDDLTVNVVAMEA